MTSVLKCSQIFINSFSALLQIITKFTSCAKTGWPYSIIASQLERERETDRERERERATERERERERALQCAPMGGPKLMLQVSTGAPIF